MRGGQSRTLPRVRELKQRRVLPTLRALRCRTLPRVRELKRQENEARARGTPVAPFPGCVN